VKFPPHYHFPTASVAAQDFLLFQFQRKHKCLE
jgi:hypothetical protein